MSPKRVYNQRFILLCLNQASVMQSILSYKIHGEEKLFHWKPPMRFFLKHLFGEFLQALIYWHDAVISNEVNLCDTFSDWTLVLLVFVDLVLEQVMPIEVILLECLIHLEIQFFWRLLMFCYRDQLPLVLPYLVTLLPGCSPSNVLAASWSLSLFFVGRPRKTWFWFNWPTCVIDLCPT